METIINTPNIGIPGSMIKPPRKLTKRLYTGVVGRGAAPRKPARETVTEALENQRIEGEKERTKADLLEAIKYDGWKAGHDDPIVKSSRARSGSGTPVFQKYQFRLRSNGAKSARWDRGMNPAIYGSMSSFQGARQAELDDENVGRQETTNDLHNTAAKTPGTTSIATVAQSMPKGFSAGVLSSSFDYTNPPRRPKPETEWIFNDTRLKYFITRLIDDTDVKAASKANLENDYWLNVIIRKFTPAIKAYVALYSHFKVGLSDQAFLDDPSLDHQRFWTSTNALKCFRGELIKKGVELFGTPKEPKEVPDYDPERVQSAWPVFVKVLRALPYALPDV